MDRKPKAGWRAGAGRQAGVVRLRTGAGQGSEDVGGQSWRGGWAGRARWAGSCKILRPKVQYRILGRIVFLTNLQKSGTGPPPPIPFLSTHALRFLEARVPTEWASPDLWNAN